MSASLVGSEMCIRDRPSAARLHFAGIELQRRMRANSRAPINVQHGIHRACLLYTSDAADDM
eukprot:3015486-Alexandrium_andersonii.AAC.1